MAKIRNGYGRRTSATTIADVIRIKKKIVNAASLKVLLFAQWESIAPITLAFNVLLFWAV
jgi:hypothetical protein